MTRESSVMVSDQEADEDRGQATFLTLGSYEVKIPVNRQFFDLYDFQYAVFQFL